MSRFCTNNLSVLVFYLVNFVMLNSMDTSGPTLECLLQLCFIHYRCTTYFKKIQFFSDCIHIKTITLLI